MAYTVLFDWDGTLADTRQVIVTTFQQVVQEIGASASADFIERRIGTGAERTFKEILKADNKSFDEALIKRLLKRKIEAEIKLGDTVRLFPGALELLKALQGKTRVALASMNNRAVIEHLLDAMKIRDCFEVILTVDEVKKFKPNPEIFLKCAEKLEVEPKDCVVIEDSIFGVQAAHAAGMKCIAVLTGVYSKTELEIAQPSLIVNSLTMKKQILDFILK